jgi:hypothetical protein
MTSIYQSIHHNILKRCKFRKKVMELKYKPYCSVPEGSERISIELEDISVVIENLPGSGTIQRSEDM